MRIHSDTLTRADLIDAVTYAAKGGHGMVWLEAATKHGSRSRDHAYEVALEADGSHSKRRRNTGHRGAHSSTEAGYAATWDQWGWFLAELFRRDPNMIATYYKSAEDFHTQTDHKFYVEAINNEEA